MATSEQLGEGLWTLYVHKDVKDVKDDVIAESFDLST